MILLALGTGFGLWRRRHDGRARAVTAGDVVSAAELEQPLGHRATLLQMSSEFCNPCRAAKRVLARVAATVPGVAHVDLDVAQHVDLVRRLDVMRTPTVLVLDPIGLVVGRMSGVPTLDDVMVALHPLVTEATNV